VQQSLYTELHPSDCLAAARALVHTAVTAADSDNSKHNKQNSFTVALIAEALHSLHQPRQGQQQQHALQQSAQSFMWPVCQTSSDSPLKGSSLLTSISCVGSDSSALSTPGAAWGAWMLRALLQLEAAEAASADIFHAGAYDLLAL
jgi:hypothetical protein